MPLQECMERHTHRQYVAWVDWLDEEWNRPSRTDHYLMQIAQWIASIFKAFSKSTTSYKLSDFKLKFVEAKPTPQDAVQEESVAEFSKRMREMHLALIAPKPKLPPKKR